MLALTNFCDKIACELLPLISNIATNSNQDPRYRLDEKISLIEELTMMEDELYSIRSHFDNLKIKTKKFVENGFAKILYALLDVARNKKFFCVELCDFMSKNLSSLMKLLFEFKDILSLYLLEILFGLALLETSSFTSSLKDYVRIDELPAINSKILPLDLESKLIIKRIFAKNYIANSYLYLIPSGKDIHKLLDKALSKTYIISMPHKYCGKTLLNLKILIHDFKSKYNTKNEINEKLKKAGVGETEVLVRLERIEIVKNVLIKVCNAIVFCHEFAHFVQRYAFKTFGDIINFESPNCSPPLKVSKPLSPDKITSFNDSLNAFSYESVAYNISEEVKLPFKKECANDSEEIKKSSKVLHSHNTRINSEKEIVTKVKASFVDTGFRIESALFGQVVKFLNYTTALIFCENELPETHNEFKELFAKYNEVKATRESMSMNKGASEDDYSIELGTCGMVNDNLDI